MAAWGVKRAVIVAGVLGRVRVTGDGFPLTRVTVILYVAVCEGFMVCVLGDAEIWYE